MYKLPQKLPRKLKKKLLGYKKTKSLLKRMIKASHITEYNTTMYDIATIEPFGLFCLECGCTDYYGSGSRVSYPEHYEYFYCIRCKSMVGWVDNSPFIHILADELTNN